MFHSHTVFIPSTAVVCVFLQMTRTGYTIHVGPQVSTEVDL